MTLYENAVEVTKEKAVKHSLYVLKTFHKRMCGLDCFGYLLFDVAVLFGACYHMRYKTDADTDGHSYNKPFTKAFFSHIQHSRFLSVQAYLLAYLFCEIICVINVANFRYVLKNLKICDILYLNKTERIAMRSLKSLILILTICMLLTACSSKGTLKPINELLGTYNDVTFESAQLASTYNFTTDVFTDNGESGLYAETQTIVEGKVSEVDEVAVKVTLPVEEIIPAEESETGEEEKKTVYVPVTAYIQLLTVKCTEVLYDKEGELEDGAEIRILNKVSSRMWDEQAIPLFEGDECILLLKSSYDSNDIMKIYDRGFAKYLLFDARNGVFKKTDKGYLASSVQDFATRDETKVDADYNSLPAEVKKCYKNAESYAKAMEGMFFVKDAKDKVLNNIRYYYEKK